MSLIIPTHQDRETGHSLNKKRLITVKRGLERWNSMFWHPKKISHGNGTYTVRLDIPPGVSQRDLDMVGDKNTQWNARTITLLASAGLITLRGRADNDLQPVQDRDPIAGDEIEWHPLQTVTILDPRHLDEKIWDERVEPERRRIMAGGRANFRRMDRFLKRTECAADTLAPLYEIPPQGLDASIGVAQACGGCPYCRARGRKPSCETAPEPRPPWKGLDPSEHVKDLLDANGRLVIFCPPGLFDSSKPPQRSDITGVRNVLREFVRAGFRNVVRFQGLHVNLVELQGDVGYLPFFVSDHLVPNALPDGPTIVLASRAEGMSEWEPVRTHRLNEARIYFLPDTYPDPSRRDTLFREVYSGRRLALEEIRERFGL